MSKIDHLTSLLRTGFLPAITLCLSLLSAPRVTRAATIVWSAPSAITGDSDVSLGGTFLYAYDWTNYVATVNGVSFTGVSSTFASTNVGNSFDTVNPTAFASGANPYNAMSLAYKSILNGSAYRIGTNDSVTLSNLVSGRTYAVQVWVSDPRGDYNNRTELLASSGGNNVTLAFSTGAGSAPGYPGQFAIGYFVADAGTQTFVLNGSIVDQLNALQVRDVTAPPAPPLVTTGIPDDFTTNGAIINGTVNPENLPTTARFRWGTTTKYGNLTITNLPPINAEFSVSSALTGLAPGITYHFTLSASNSSGASQGLDQIFAIPRSGPMTASPALFSTFGPDYGYSYLVESRYAASSFRIAMPFRPKATGLLGRIIVPVYNVITPSQIRFALDEDNGGVPGANLESWSVNNPVYGALTPLKSVYNPTLDSARQYWLVASADDSTTQSYWWIGPLDGSIPSYNLYSTNQGATWDSAPVPDCAFEVDAANPIITGFAAANANLTLTATNGLAGHNYVTLVGSNINQAFSLWKPVATNTVTLDGGFSVFATNAVDPESTQQFYILKMQ